MAACQCLARGAGGVWHRPDAELASQRRAGRGNERRLRRVGGRS